MLNRKLYKDRILYIIMEFEVDVMVTVSVEAESKEEAIEKAGLWTGVVAEGINEGVHFIGAEVKE